MEVIRKNDTFELKLNEYEIDKEYNITTPNSAWFLLRKEFIDDRMNDYNLREGDIFKIGRIIVRIRTIKFAKNNNKNNDNNNDNNSINTNFSQNLKEIQIEHNKIKKVKEPKEAKSNRLCRICYGEEENDKILYCNLVHVQAQ